MFLVDFGEAKQLTQEKIEEAREIIEKNVEDSKGSASHIDVQLSFSDEQRNKVSWQKHPAVFVTTII